MKYFTLICGFISFSIFAEPPENKQFYLYTDEFGNQTYSDKPPADDREFISTKIKPINSTSWGAVPQINLKPDKKKRSNSLSKYQKELVKKHQSCIKKAYKIDKLQNKLRQKLKIRKFDLIKQQLRTLRLEHRKSCT